MLISNLGANYPPKAVKAKVELYQGSTLAHTCTCGDVLSDFTISRAGEPGKFFGFGVCHELNMKLIDLEKVLRIFQGYTTKIYLGDGEVWDIPYPDLEVTEVKVDKKSGDLTVTAYDVINTTTEHTFDELNITAPYTLKALAQAIANLLGISLHEINDDAFDVLFEGNYDGTETIRVVLNQIAEVTQTIYFIDANNSLKFIRLTPNSVADYTREEYYEFETETSKVINGICNATELGDNLTVVDDTITTSAVTQYIRNNALWELREDLDTLLQASIERVSGLELVQFALDWSGDYLLEIGDCITVYFDDDATKVYIINDVVKYDGTISEVTSWEYADSNEIESNPVNIGDKINDTSARVDKINKEITLQVNSVTEEQESIKSSVSSLQVKSEGISATVTTMEQTTGAELDALEQQINTLSKEVGLKVDNEGVEIVVEKVLGEGVEKVVTASKKYTFDDSGLNVGSSSSNISTLITEDGMRVYRSNAEVLRADNEGVIAEDLHATTYLIIGTTSRLEDRGNRTACFWIGG